MVDGEVNIAELDFDAVQLNRKAVTCNRKCRFSDSTSKKMIVRMLIRLCLLNTLFSLFIQDNRLGVDAKLCSMAASASGEAKHGSFKDPIDHVEMINARVETSRLLVDTLKIRGGQAIVGKKIKKKSPFKAVKEVLAQIAPATRAYLLMCTFCTIVHVVGLPAPELFSLSTSKLYELWRPITSVAYFGPPSMSMANNIYFLVRYGQTLEALNGTGAHAWFLFVQTVLLSLLGFLFGFPFQASAMISATVYASSHLSPMQTMPFQFGLMITSWQLPFCMMGIDCLSQQSIAAAWPHVLGIFSGHFYHFFTKVWPALGGKAWLEPPKWFTARFGGKRNSNIEGVDFRKDKDSVKGKARKIKKGTGRKLGGASK